MRRARRSVCPTAAKAVISARAISKPPATALAAARTMSLNSFPVAMLPSSQPVDLAVAWLDCRHFAFTTRDAPYRPAFPVISLIAWRSA